MATITTTSTETAEQKASHDNAVATSKATNAAHDKAHDDISKRNAAHEDFVNARKELADNHERDVMPYGEVDGNRDTRGKRNVRDGNVAEVPAVTIEAHRADREWLQHEDFEGGAARAQELRDASDRAERQADRDEIAAERQTVETGAPGHSGLPSDAKASNATVTTSSLFRDGASGVGVDKSAIDKENAARLDQARVAPVVKS